MTRRRLVVGLVLATIVLVVLVAPGHLALVALIAAAAFLATVVLGVVHGVRDAAAAGDETEPPD